MDKKETYIILGISLGEKITAERIPVDEVTYSGLAKYVEGNALLKKLGMKVDVTEIPNDLDFFRTLGDGLIVSKVTTDSKRYSGFVCD